MVCSNLAIAYCFQSAISRPKILWQAGLYLIKKEINKTIAGTEYFNYFLDSY